jgi:hypothetical protein
MAFDPLAWFRADEPEPPEPTLQAEYSLQDELGLSEAGIFCLACLEAPEVEQIEELESVYSDS